MNINEDCLIVEGFKETAEKGLYCCTLPKNCKVQKIYLKKVEEGKWNFGFLDDYGPDLEPADVIQTGSSDFYMICEGIALQRFKIKTMTELVDLTFTCSRIPRWTEADKKKFRWYNAFNVLPDPFTTVLVRMNDKYLAAQFMGVISRKWSLLTLDEDAITDPISEWSYIPDTKKIYYKKQ